MPAQIKWFSLILWIFGCILESLVHQGSISHQTYKSFKQVNNVSYKINQFTHMHMHAHSGTGKIKLSNFKQYILTFLIFQSSVLRYSHTCFQEELYTLSVHQEKKFHIGDCKPKLFIQNYPTVFSHILFFFSLHNFIPCTLSTNLRKD